MLPALVGFASKALLPAAKKISKDKLLNRKKSSAIQKVDGEQGVVKEPKIEKKTISTNLFLPQPEIKALPPAAEVKKDVKSGNLKDIFKRVGETLQGIIDTLKNRNQTQKEEESNKKQKARVDEKKEREEKLEKDAKKKPVKGKIKTPKDKFNLMNFFGNVLLGSLALAIFENLEKIIDTLKNVYKQVTEFLEKLEEFFAPVWNAFKWIAGKGTELIGQLLGIPKENLDDKDILKNLNEIKNKIPFLENLFNGINSTIESLRSGRGLTQEQPNQEQPDGSRAAGPTQSGDLFEIIAGGEGGYNSVNRGDAGDTPGGAQSIFGKPLTEMTVGEVVKAQQTGKVFAVGKYQIIPKTMTGFLTQMKISSNDKFDETTQEKFKEYVINYKRPEVGKYIRGESSNRAEAAQELAREFASVGLSYAEVGKERGQSRYAGTAGNRASIAPETIEAALDRARSGTSTSKPAASGVSAEAKQIQDTGTYTVAGATYDVKTGAPVQTRKPEDLQPAAQISSSQTTNNLNQTTNTQISSSQTTNNLNQTTNNLNQTTNNLNQTTNNLNQTTNNLNQTQISSSQTTNNLNQTTNNLNQTQISSSQTTNNLNQTSITQAQVSSTQAPPAVSASVPQIMQQAEYEIPGGAKSAILPIPMGGGSAPMMMGGGGTRVVPIGVSKQALLNSYYQTQLIGFLYKQG